MIYSSDTLDLRAEAVSSIWKSDQLLTRMRDNQDRLAAAGDRAKVVTHCTSATLANLTTIELVALGAHYQALELFDGCVNKFPSNQYLRLNRALTYGLLNELERCVLELDRCSEYMSTPEMKTHRAYCEQKYRFKLVHEDMARQKASSAIGPLREAYETSPTDLEVALQLSEALGLFSRFDVTSQCLDEAVACLEKIASRHPKCFDVWYRLLAFYVRLEDIDGIHKTASKIDQINPRARILQQLAEEAAGDETFQYRIRRADRLVFEIQNGKDDMSGASISALRRLMAQFPHNAALSSRYAMVQYLDNYEERKKAKNLPNGGTWIESLFRRIGAYDIDEKC